MSLIVGQKVRHPKKPEWGVGIVTACSGNKATVAFEAISESKQILTDICPLQSVDEVRKPSITEQKAFVSRVEGALKQENEKARDDDGYLKGSVRDNQITEWNPSDTAGRTFPGWKLGPTSDRPASQVVRNFWREAHTLNLQLFESRMEDLLPSYSSPEEANRNFKGLPFHTFIFALPDATIEQVIEFTRAGTTNMDPNAWKDVAREMRSAWNLWAFEILVARSDYIECEFVKPLTDKKTARRIRELLPGGTFDTSEEETISRTGFHIGWD